MISNFAASGTARKEGPTMNKHRKIRVTPQRKRKPDYRKMTAALQAYLAAQAEVDAEAVYEQHPRRPKAS